MRTCPRCQAKHHHSLYFCRKCGYKFSGPSFGLLQYVPHPRSHWQNSKKLFRAKMPSKKIQAVEEGSDYRQL